MPYIESMGKEATLSRFRSFHTEAMISVDLTLEQLQSVVTELEQAICYAESDEDPIVGAYVALRDALPQEVVQS